MAVGDMFAGHATLLPTQTALIRPSGADIEWAIHNIYVPLGCECELYRTDGTTPIKVMNLSVSLLSYNMHCSNSYYVSVKNVGSTNVTIAYDGLVMQE